MPPRIHIVGRRNSGKTTLVCDLVRELTARGLKVATVKHTHHRHELDTPGKDSYLHREAGAAAVGILSPRMTAMFVPTVREERGEHRYELFETQFADCDLILVEGDLQATATRIEVWRSVTGEAPYAVQDLAIRAVITDDDVSAWSGQSSETKKARLDEETGLSGMAGIELWARQRIDKIADRLLQLNLPATL